MSFNYFEHINELMESNPEKAVKSLERHEKNLLNDPINLHFAYNQMIDLYYKKRDNEFLLEQCIEICKKDIEITPTVIKLMEKDPIWRHHNENGDLVFTPPRFPSFQRLAIIYENQEKYEEAIELCKLAIKLNLRDGTKTGFEGRIKRLERKLNTSK